MNAIETSKLTKYYGKARGIIEVDLSVENGDFFGFIGPNGAGKSTFIRTLLGLISPTKGEARVLGLDITTQRTDILKRIGYLPGETAFYHGMTVAQTLEFFAGLRGVDCSAEADALCKRLDLDKKKKINELSLGNRKKLGIVCALQHKPELYILDEPTSGLDPLMQKEFYDILSERNVEGATVFLSSHVLSEIGRYCKHAAVIREGRILVSDSVHSLAHTGVKRVSLTGAGDISAIPDIRDVRHDADRVSFLYSGSSRELVRALANVEFEDLSVSDPELDEVFMHYYAREES